MNNSKYKQCVTMLKEMHEIIHIIIETGEDGDMSAIDILEEAVRAMRLLDDEVEIKRTKIKPVKNKGLIH